MADLLTVRDLRVRYARRNAGHVPALNGLSLLVRAGETLGILGESGCGKSTLAKSLLRLLPRTAQIDGEIEFEGRDILQLNENGMQEIRGARIALVPQEPGLALNPVMKIGDQVGEVLRAHRGLDAKRCRAQAEQALDRVGLHASSRRFYDAYPHQLSGGQQQRAVIAQALACGPSLIVADEPTASLDSETQTQILDLFRELKAKENTSFLFITHNPELLGNFADRVAVIYAGRAVEITSANALFENARHPYTSALLACVPAGEAKLAQSQRLPAIAGTSPDPENPMNGCSFAPRCGKRMELCESQQPHMQAVHEEEAVECFLYDR